MRQVYSDLLAAWNRRSAPDMAALVTDDVTMIGFDASPTEVDYLKQGIVQALVVQDPFRMGFEGVKAVAQIVRGQGDPPRRIDTGATVVTKENLDTPAVRKLVNPLGTSG